MKCIGASATAEDDKEEENQQSPAMLKKKQRKYLLDPSAEEDADVQPPAANDKSVSKGGKAASRETDTNAVEDWPIDIELFGAAEMAEMAAMLLQMILELCGMPHSMQRNSSKRHVLDLQNSLHNQILSAQVLGLQDFTG